MQDGESKTRASKAVSFCKQFVDLLKAGGLTDAELYDHANFQFVRWHKVAINSAMNSTAVLTGGAGNQEVAIDPDLAKHAKGVMDEVLVTASKVLDMPLKPTVEELKLASPEQVLASVRKNTTGSRPSMWHDWEKGQKMELEVILGNPIRIAREYEIEMPRLQTMYALLKKAQERRDMEGQGSKL